MTNNLRDIVRQNGWGEIADIPEPIELGTTARTDADEVVTLRAVRIEILREAAKLVALDQNYEVLFGHFLREAMGHE